MEGKLLNKDILGRAGGITMCFHTHPYLKIWTLPQDSHTAIVNVGITWEAFMTYWCLGTPRFTLKQ